MKRIDKIKAMDIDEMAEYFFNLTQICELEKKCSACIKNSWCSSSTPKDFKKWLSSTKNCGNEQKLVGYADNYFFIKVLPSYYCKKCGKNRAGEMKHE